MPTIHTPDTNKSTSGRTSQPHAGIEHHDPDYFHALRNLRAAAWTNTALPTMEKHLVCLAAAAAVTDLDHHRIEHHIESALASGATHAHIIEVLELTSALGVHACTEGVPALLEAMADAHLPPIGALDSASNALREEFTASRGYWSEIWDGLLAIDPRYFGAYSKFSAHPWQKGTLPPRLKELVYIAFDATAKHLYSPGLRIHMRNALAHGATPAQIVNVLTLLSTLGERTMSEALPILDRIVGQRNGSESK
jgi:alkylhydroperoxidase/carboxymuconolactone decarboxylase family protein YurZ